MVFGHVGPSMDPIPIRLTPEMQQQVDRLANELALSRSAVLRLAIRQWLEAHELHGINPMLRESPSQAAKSGKKAQVTYPKKAARKKPGA